MPTSPNINNADDDQAAPPPKLIGVVALAEMLGVSPGHVRRLVDAGKAPPPLRLGSCVRWSRAVIDEWVAGGCPNCRKMKSAR